VSGDYLWDRTGPPDPEVVRLERMLAEFAQAIPPAPLRLPPAVPVPRRRLPGVLLAIAATVTLALVGLTWRDRLHPAATWEVTRVTGAPAVASRVLSGTEHVREGTLLDTRADGRVAIAVGEIGQVQLEPDTHVALLRARPGDYRLELDRGTMHALIWAPPGQFSVETPGSTAIDLGCAYTMTVNDDGTGLIRVTSGWVGFGWHGREAFIPEGAVCRTRPALGPGTPYFDDSSAAFVAALDVLDSHAATAEAERVALDRVLADARSRDSVTLWHLLSRVPAPARDRVFDRLASFVPAPPGVTREGIRDGRQDMLDTWWNYLGFGSTNWWRVWEQEWRHNSRGR
jgi:hypothetical protein